MSNKYFFTVISLVGIVLLVCGLTSCGYSSNTTSNATSSKNYEDGVFEITPEFADIINKADYDYIDNFSDGFARVKKNGKFGLVNNNGEEVVPCIYRNVGNFSEGLAMVDNGKYGFVNSSGELVIPCIYDIVKNFSEGLACVTKYDERGLLYGIKEYFINKKGEEVIPHRDGLSYSSINGFSDGLIIVRKKGEKATDDPKYGYMNTKGELVSPCIYDSAEEFSYGLAKVKKAGKWGYINTNGEEVTPFIYDYESAKDFSDGLAAVSKVGKWGYINTKGEEIIPCVYGGAGSFSDGLAAVSKAGKWGYINTKGEEVIPCIYEVAYRFSDGLAKVRKEVGQWSYWGYVNTDGKEVIPCIYDQAGNIYKDGVGDFSEGLVVVEKDEICGFVNKDGKDTFFGPAYEELKKKKK